MKVYKSDHIDIDAIQIHNEGCYELTSQDRVAIYDAPVDGYLCHRILKYLVTLAKRDYMPLILSDKKDRFGQYYLTTEGTHLFKNAARMALLSKARAYYKLHPRLEFFYTFVMSNDVLSLIEHARVDVSTHMKLHQLLTKLYSGLRSFKLLNDIDNFTKGPEKNYKSLSSYINSLFNVYARLLVIRVDLSYLKEYRNSITIEEVVKHRQAILNNRRKGALATKWVGCAWRLEYGKETGYHLHVVIFFDGSRHRSDFVWGSEISTEWEKVTGGRGRSFECNRDFSRYRYVGIGMVDHHDSEKRRFLLKALFYLTKGDKIAKLSLGKIRTFGRGTLKNKKTNKGRKRTRHNSLSTWRRA